MPKVDINHGSLEAFSEWMNRPAHISAGDGKILVIKQPAFPQFRFEWHPKSKKVYLVRMGRLETVDGEKVFVPCDPNTPLRGERLAEHVESHGMAYNFVQTFLRGWRERDTPDIPKIHLED